MDRSQSQVTINYPSMVPTPIKALGIVCMAIFAGLSICVFFASLGQMHVRNYEGAVAYALLGIQSWCFTIWMTLGAMTWGKPVIQIVQHINNDEIRQDSAA